MTGTDGWPYVIPMNFGYTWDEDGLTLYFHGGVKGKKIDSLGADPRICFELDCEGGSDRRGRLGLPVQLCVLVHRGVRQGGICKGQ